MDDNSISRKGRLRAIKIIVIVLANIVGVYLFVKFSPAMITIVDVVILCTISSLLGWFVASFCISPNAFLKAVGQRLFRPIALIVSIFCQLFAVALWLFLYGIKAVVGLGIAIAYGVWPVDLVPDIFFGLGWIDDAVVLAVGAYYGLAIFRMGIVEGVKDFAKGVEHSTRITTKFP